MDGSQPPHTKQICSLPECGAILSGFVRISLLLPVFAVLYKRIMTIQPCVAIIAKSIRTDNQQNPTTRQLPVPANAQ